MKCHVNSVRRFMKRAGRKVRPVPRNYSLDESFFHSLTKPYQAYWLGFLLADGSLKRNSYGTPSMLVLGISKTDRTHLEKFRRDIGFSGPIKEIRYFDKRYGKTYERSQVDLVSKRLCGFLLDIGWDRFKKSGSVDILNSVPKSLQVDLVRGLIDGDGCVSLVLRGRKTKPMFHFTDLHRSVVEWVFEFLAENLGIRVPLIRRNGNGTRRGYCAQYVDLESVRACVSLLYGENVALERKAKAAGEILNHQPVTKIELGKNCGHAKLLTFNGITDTKSGWCRRLGISMATLRDRFRGGWTLQEALSIPKLTTNHRPPGFRMESVEK